MTTEDDHEGGEAGAEVLTGTGKHSGGVTTLSFASSLETHKMRMLTCGNPDLAVYEWVLTPCAAFLKRTARASGAQITR